MDSFWAETLERASRFGHNIASIPVHSPEPGGAPAPIQRVRLDGARRPNAYARQPAEDPEVHRRRMAGEMQALRDTMAANDALAPEARSPHDYYGPQWPGDWPDEPRREHDPRRRAQVLERIGGARPRPPTVAVSYRGGFGYDSGVFSRGSTRADVVSAPPGFGALPRTASAADTERREAEVIDARDPRAAETHLARASGLYIPGGQDIPASGSPEQRTRETYEQALISGARLRGMPTLAVCGGSRCLAGGFGGREATLSAADQRIHNQKRTIPMPHGLSLAPHTILGGARGGTVDAINSTHQKIVDYDPASGELRGVNRLPGTGEPELRVSARDGSGHPEGFETTHGAPIVGVTSHPEAIHGASREARAAATPQGRAWSDNVLRGFEQSMQAYAARQEVNAQVREQAGGMRLRPPAVQLPEHLRETDPDYHRVPPIIFGRARPSSRRGGSRL